MNKSELKKGGILEKALGIGVCESCGNLIHINENCFGCIVTDKIIIPKYPPYTATNKRKCKNWSEK